MRAIERRVRALEDRYRLGPPTAFELQLLARLEAGKRRLAELEGQTGRPHTFAEGKDLSGLSIEEILLRGRMRNAARPG